MTEFSLNHVPAEHREWATLRTDDLELHITGRARVESRSLAGGRLAEAVANQLRDDTVTDVLERLEGTFSLAVARNGEVHVAADRPRTVPVFYRREGQTVHVSSDADAIRGDRPLRHRGLVEYATAGFVSRHHTLFEDVYGVQSGELVSFGVEEEPQPRRLDYYQYRCKYDRTAEIDDLCDELDDILLDVWSDLVGSLDGRQVVIPLSGGFDSRLVASMFRRLDYDNVLCYAYGVEDNDEAKTSRDVASQLGYPWTFFEYTGDLWRRTLRSEQMEEYWRYAANGVSLPHVNDWPAVRQMTGEERIDDDAVFVPGHTGDFLSGGHLAYLLDPDYAERPGDLVSAIIDKHYSRWLPLLTRENTAILEEEITAYESALEGESAPAIYEFWEWRERQAKYILNSLRVYEFFDYDWRVPLWDTRLMEFWRGIPIEQKVNQNLYVHYLTTGDPTGVFSGASPPGRWEPGGATSTEEGGLVDRLREWAEETPLERLFQHYRHLVYYRNRPLGIGRGYGASYVLRHPGKRHHESLVLRDVMMDLYDVDPLDLK